jgi:hypothetical protein
MIKNRTEYHYSGELCYKQRDTRNEQSVDYIVKPPNSASNLSRLSHLLHPSQELLRRLQFPETRRSSPPWISRNKLFGAIIIHNICAIVESLPTVSNIFTIDFHFSVPNIEVKGEREATISPNALLDVE